METLRTHIEATCIGFAARFSRCSEFIITVSNDFLRLVGFPFCAGKSILVTQLFIEGELS